MSVNDDKFMMLQSHILDCHNHVEKGGRVSETLSQELGWKTAMLRTAPLVESKHPSLTTKVLMVL